VKPLFISRKLTKIFLMTGDQDTVINFIGTEEWIYNTGRPIVNDWAPWYYSRDGSDSNRQIGGWMVRFDRITFMTVKGAGHMVNRSLVYYNTVAQIRNF
jgi:hypothetical protein